jgi:hypothetical protein
MVINAGESEREATIISGRRNLHLCHPRRKYAESGHKSSTVYGYLPRPLDRSPELRQGLNPKFAKSSGSQLPLPAQVFPQPDDDDDADFPPQEPSCSPRRKKKMAAFGGQTPTIIVLKDGETTHPEYMDQSART